jgi:hypothetical protein
LWLQAILGRQTEQKAAWTLKGAIHEQDFTGFDMAAMHQTSTSTPVLQRQFGHISGVIPFSWFSVLPHITKQVAITGAMHEKYESAPYSYHWGAALHR